MNDAARMRFEWIRLYEQIGNAGIVCNRCGISRPTLRKWLKRYKAEGEAGLESQSRKPIRSPGRRVNEKEEAWVSELRGRGLGARRIQNELVRQHKFHVSLRTIHKTLQRLKMTPRKRKRRNKESRRYEREIPGDRVQIDNMKIREDLHQYTAIDDCTRLKIIRLYPAKSAQNTSHFVDIVIQELPFPIQRIQTDRGQEFFAYEVQDKLRSKRIKFRPIPPASPHLNGKVERAQRTDWDEFYTSTDLNDPDLPKKLMEWQTYYNHERPHGSLQGKTPWEKWLSAQSKVPTLQDILAGFDSAKETAQTREYADQVRLKRLKQA